MRTVLRRSLLALMAAALLAVGVAAAGVAVGAWRFAVVERDVTHLALAPGVPRPVPADELRAGQVLVLPMEVAGGQPEFRRVVSVGVGSGHLVVRTKADDAARVDRVPVAMPVMSTAWVVSERIPVVAKALPVPPWRMAVVAAAGAAPALVAGLLLVGRRRRRDVPARPVGAAPFSEYWWRQLDPAGPAASAGIPMAPHLPTAAPAPRAAATPTTAGVLPSPEDWSRLLAG